MGFYTSGAIGKLKGVIITDGMLKAMALAYFADVNTISSQDVVINTAAMSHCTGLCNVAFQWSFSAFSKSVGGSFRFNFLNQLIF